MLDIHSRCGRMYWFERLKVVGVSKQALLMMGDELTAAVSAGAAAG